MAKVRLVPAGWAAAYAALLAWWAITGTPRFAGSGLSFFPDLWTPVVAALVAATACLLVARGSTLRWSGSVRWAFLFAGWAAAGVVIVFNLLFWINLTMILMAPFGVPLSGDDVAGVVVRAAGVGAGLLTLWALRVELRRVRSACVDCGRVHGRSPERRSERSPWWAYAAGYLAVVGLVVRLTPAVLEGGIAQGPGGFGFTLFVCLLITSGTLLPMALAYRWGRIWPRWVVPFAGRSVPRWLVLGPGLFMGAGLCAYFGGGGVTAMVTGATAVNLVVAVEIGGYVVWGVALLIVSVSYHRLTKPRCARPGPLGT